MPGSRPVDQYDQPFIQMNGSCYHVQHTFSGAVLMWGHDRRARPSGQTTRGSISKETTMLKVISAALLAASVFVAPAMAGTARTGHAPATKSVTLKSKVLNSNAKMGRHHRRARPHVHHRHHHHR
jgi:hypothetical protein